MAQKFDQETFDFLTKDNKINEEKFKEFHKKVFEEMMEQAKFLVYYILKKKRGERPGVGDFDKKFSDLLTDLMQTKTEMLGSYLKK